MPKISKVDAPQGVIQKQMKTRDKLSDATDQGYKWWLANSKKQTCEEVLATVGFLKEAQAYRYRQAGIYARLYGNMPLFNFFGSSVSKLGQANTLPIDRPTMNVVQSCIDTLVSRLTQSKPRPVFLTDNGDYKERKLAKQMNAFTNGELYQTKAYSLGEIILRDAAALGTGCLKIYENTDHRVALDRVLLTELLVDPNDALYGDPRQLFHLKLVDKSVLMEVFPDYKSEISKAEQAFPDSSSESTRTISDQLMIAEAWHLPSGKDASDGRHVIACSSGLILDEEYTKDKFPFVFLPFCPRIVGFWAQGLAEQLMGTQIAINKLLIQMDRSIELITPVWLIEKGSKMPKSHFNNQLGRLQEFSGTPPIYTAPEPYNQVLPMQLERLVNYAYQQSGISALAATSQKPAGLNSGEAIRNYDDLQSDRFAALARRYDNFYIDLAYQIIDKAKDIAEREGSYQTVYPHKDSSRQIDLPNIERLKDPFVIQCYDASSLPREPAGRLQKVTEMMQSGLVTPQEGRRLLDFPDIEQVDKLANAGEERILQILDMIVEKGADAEIPMPDPFMNLDLATELTTQYYNLYAEAGLEEAKANKLRTFFTQIQTLKQAALPPPMPMAPGASPGQPGTPPQAVPQAPPVSDMLPNAPQQ